MALATLTLRDLRNMFILTFQIGKFSPSNLGGDLMLEKSCDAMKNNMSAKTNNKYCKSAFEVWNDLIITHEGTSQNRDPRLIS